jgi:hypothetical protein
MGGAGGRGPYISQPLWSSGKKKALDVGGPSSIDCKYFWWSNKKQRNRDGRGGAQRPVWRGNEPKKTGARSARARTRGLNPLVLYVYVTKLTKETKGRVSRGRY